MEMFSVREAAERCGVSYQAMRKRVDRGSVQTVKRDGRRLIPRRELERNGLWPGARDGDGDEVAGLREENERLRTDLAQHRQLTERAEAAAVTEREARERAEHEFHRERAERLASEQSRAETDRERDELRGQLEQITNAGPIQAFRLRRRLRAEHSAPR